MPRVLVLVLFALAASALVSAPSVGSDSCTSAQIEEPFALPDGSVHPAGRLTLCPGGPSPVFSLQRTYVDGRPVGMFTSRRRIVEQTGNAAYYLEFYRLPGRPLQLAGYGQPAGQQTAMFVLEGAARVEVEDSITFGVPSPSETSGSRAVDDRPDPSRR